MKHKALQSFVISVILSSLAFGQITNPMAQAAPSCGATGIPNPNQLALLRWYDANTAARIALGGTPIGMAFDGSNLWVVNAPANSVSKLRTSDGALLGTFSVGHAPGYAAFDGANVWVTNLLDNTVSELRASDGATLGTFPQEPFLGALPLTEPAFG